MQNHHADLSEFERLERRLYGNGQPGDIGRLYGAVDEARDDYTALKLSVAAVRSQVTMWGAIIAVLTLLGGSGTVSLKALLELWK